MARHIVGTINLLINTVAFIYKHLIFCGAYFRT